MKKEEEEKVQGLPENAYRELKEGEVYHPIMSPEARADVPRGDAVVRFLGAGDGGRVQRGGRVSGVESGTSV